MSNIEFTTFEAPTTVNPYTETVEALAKADNPNAAVVITVPTVDAPKHILKFQQAANAIGKTARKRMIEDITKGDEKGNTKVTFTLTTKHAQRRGK